MSKQVPAELKGRDGTPSGPDGPARLHLNGTDGSPQRTLMSIPEVFQAAVDASNSMICISDVRQADQPLVYCNGGFRKFTGYRDEDIVGTNCRFLQRTADGRRDDGTLGFSHDLQQREALAAVRDAVRVGDHCNVVLRNYRKDGTPFWNELFLTPIFSDEGEYVAVVGVQNDVTDRVEAERQVRHQAENAARRLAELNAAFSAAPVGIVTLDGELCLVRANSEFVSIMTSLGGPTDIGSAGRPAAEALPSDVWRQIAPTSRRVLANGGRETLDVFAGLGRESRVLDVRLLAIHDGRYLPIGVSLAVQDVTDVRRKERELADANEHLAAARVSAERAKERAERASKAKDDFLAILSHELRTPLTPVSAGVQLLRDEMRKVSRNGESISADKADEWATMLDNVLKNVELEARLIDDLLDHTRIARGKLKLTRGPVNLTDVARQTLAICGAEAREKGVSLEAPSLPAAGDGPCVEGDPMRLRQIAWNLVGNAVKYTPPGGRITVSVENLSGGLARLSVADTGVGIRAEMMPRIFEPFEQDGANPAGRKGLGLGLAICRRLAEAHDGTLIAESEGDGKGATFTLVLPRVDDELCDEADAVGAGGDEVRFAGLDPQEANTRPPRVLVLEDNRDTARLMATYVRRRFSAKVRIAGTLAEATEQHAAAVDAGEAFDLILSDIGLPDGSGTELLVRLRTTRPDADVPPAIALSGYGTDADLAATRAAGFSDHLVKPVDFDRLLAAIRTAVA